jgi:endonuclease/exonuclease/phosphatase family metal-dependent hydrolase
MTVDDREAPSDSPTKPAAGNGSTLMLGTMNLLNLARVGRRFYANQDPYDDAEYLRKTGWLGRQVQRLNADLLAVQEVWDESALKDVVRGSGLRYRHVLAPGVESGAHTLRTPRVGLATRLDLQGVDLIERFPEGHAVPVPEIGLHEAFERPVLHARLHLRNGALLHVLVVHLKSKRPKLLRDAQDNPLEDADDPRVLARASLRALVMRAAEAAALRDIVVRLLDGTRDPLVLMGDLNDGPLSATTQMIAATHAIAWDREARDIALFHAYDVQTASAVRRDVGYSHLYQGLPDTLDQIWVSEEFVAASKFAIGDVVRVEHFNDHLNEGRDRTRSDHGFVRALLRLR